MRDPISRRTVFLGAGAVALAIAGGALTWRSLADAHTAVRTMIMQHLRGAAVAEGAVDAFVAEFLRRHRVHLDGVAIGNVCDMSGFDALLPACANNAAYLRRLEEQVIDLFIRSSDVFEPSRPAGAPVRYVAFWDPYSSACRNPLADLT
ncbi:MAG TPA: hypothetical protein VHM01_22515 [Alphaproteobacteria bacterium]|nr:hypothetical protein [Alphaproteobacteria bacterium]